LNAQLTLGQTSRQWDACPTRTDLSAAPWTAVTNILPASLVRTIAVDSAVAGVPLDRYYRVTTPLIP